MWYHDQRFVMTTIMTGMGSISLQSTSLVSKQYRMSDTVLELYLRVSYGTDNWVGQNRSKLVFLAPRVPLRIPLMWLLVTFYRYISCQWYVYEMTWKYYDLGGALGWDRGVKPDAVKIERKSTTPAGYRAPTQRVWVYRQATLKQTDY